MVMICVVELIVSFLIVFTSLYFVKEFYEKSIKTKTEIRK